MPIYVYKCKDCEIEFESLEKVDTKKKACPVCSKKCPRIITTLGASIFKGPGFYSWENRTKSYLDGAAKEIRREK